MYIHLLNLFFPIHLKEGKKKNTLESNNNFMHSFNFLKNHEDIFGPTTDSNIPSIQGHSKIC
jgi:hypothetical protein